MRMGVPPRTWLFMRPGIEQEEDVYDICFCLDEFPNAIKAEARHRPPERSTPLPRLQSPRRGPTCRRLQT
jgi:hypothetical protein